MGFVAGPQRITNYFASLKVTNSVPAPAQVGFAGLEVTKVLLFTTFPPYHGGVCWSRSYQGIAIYNVPTPA